MISADEILRKHDEMVAERANHEVIWKMIAERLRPLRKHFNSKSTTPGDRRGQQVYHSGPLSSLANFKAGLYGRMTNPATEWFEIRVAGDEELNDYSSVREWREEVSRIISLSFSPALSNFYNQTPQVYADIGAFGTGCLYTQEIPGQGRFFDKSVSLEELYIAKNEWDEIDTASRIFSFTARQAVQKFGEEVSQEIRNANERNSMQKFEFVHMVLPNPEFVQGSIGPKGFAFASVYVERDKRKTVKEEGFHTFPYHVARWEVASGETYGRGQGEIALADILSLNAMRKSNLTMAERQSNPVLLAHDELGSRGGVRAFPGSIVHGGISAEGRKMLSPLDEGKNLSLSVEYENMVNDAVKDAFFFSLMQIQGSADMTATEFIGRQEETLRLLGPHVGRIESELLTPLIKRRFDILDAAFQIPPPPDEIVGAPLEIQYVSPMARMQKVERASAAMRALNGLLMGAQLDPSIADRFSGNDFADIMEDGIGSGILRSREEAEKISEQRNQQQQMMMAMQNAPGLAKAAKDAKEVVAQ